MQPVQNMELRKILFTDIFKLLSVNATCRLKIFCHLDKNNELNRSDMEWNPEPATHPTGLWIGGGARAWAEILEIEHGVGMWVGSVGWQCLSQRPGIPFLTVRESRAGQRLI